MSDWDNIPSLNLEMDTDYDSRVKGKEGRRSTRIDTSALKHILAQGMTLIPIRVATVKQGVFDGVIVDLSETGVRFTSSKSLTKDEKIKVGFKIDERTIISKAIIRWVCSSEKDCTVGIEFQGLSPADQDFLRTLTTASLFNKTGAFRV